MKLKKIMSILAMTIILFNTVSVYASSHPSSKCIPKYMDPGTTITFDKNNDMIILQEGEKVKYEIDKNNSADSKDVANLPLVEEGMIVTYDGFGSPVIINKVARESTKLDFEKVKEFSKDNEPKDNNETLIQLVPTIYNQWGKVSWYYASGYKGQSGVTLDEWSAGHKTLPWWTPVTVESTEDVKASKVYILDRGTFSPGVILDIDIKRFETDFYPISKGLFNAKLTWGTL